MPKGETLSITKGSEMAEVTLLLLPLSQAPTPNTLITTARYVWSASTLPASFFLPPLLCLCIRLDIHYHGSFIDIALYKTTTELLLYFGLNARLVQLLCLVYYSLTLPRSIDRPIDRLALPSHVPQESTQQLAIIATLPPSPKRPGHPSSHDRRTVLADLRCPHHSPAQRLVLQGLVNIKIVLFVVSLPKARSEPLQWRGGGAS